MDRVLTLQVSGLHFSCVSFKNGLSLCWGTLWNLSKMLNMGICDACLMGLTSSLEGTSIWGYPGNWSKKKKTR